MKALNDKSALVLFSGGQDSTTCLYWALERYEHVLAISFDYGQRHAVETQQAEKIAKDAGVPLKQLRISSLAQLGGNALTDDIAVENNLDAETGLPNTFVPGRNLFFLTLAAAYAYQIGAKHIVGGMCETDYSGYPDCRQDFVSHARQTINLAMEAQFEIHTPLMYLDKAATWQLADKLGCLEVIVNDSHTCYNNDREHFHAWGYGCGECPACELRRTGYERALLD